ncbi:unnamed protein product [Symbiodinium microadriaticum]|nr:unnamed protein product [Symbiodinium microadriaticum]
MLDWLDEHEIEDSEELASNFVEYGFTQDDLDNMVDLVGSKHLPMVLGWFNQILSTEKLVSEIEDASKRINELVTSIKGYTHMDQAPEKAPSDIHQGLNNTLVMLNHKLKRMTVHKEYAENLPHPEILEGPMNQVWTNLIDNAIDAMEDASNKTLTVRTYQDGEFINIEIEDAGSGIPEEIQDKIFDPFFTTKDIGKGIEDFTGAGIYYGAATTEAGACQNQDVFIVGGGNSAGQAAMYLSKFAKNVFIIIRKPDLTSSMSSYLIDQINDTPNIEVLGGTEVIEVCGSERLERVKLKTPDGETEHDAAALFIFIGAKPKTDWLQLDLLKDQKGYLETGQALAKYENFKRSWKLEREPFLLETCIPGIFAAGDVRAGAMNRVASAVGEGSMAIKMVHEYLAYN